MTPTPTQALLLFGILARHGEARQGELMPAPKAADREALAKAGLIRVVKAARSYTLALTDTGWAWVADNPAADLPSPFRTLSDLLARLTEHFARDGSSLAEMIGAKPRDPAEQVEERQQRLAGEAEKKKRTAEEKQAEADSKAKADKDKDKAAQPKGTNGTRRPAAPRPPTQAALRTRIEEAYLKLSNGRKDESVRLAKLRAEFVDLDRPTLDAALGRILEGDKKGNGQKKASLMRNDDPRQLTDADHNAAYNPSGEPFHILWIAS